MRLLSSKIAIVVCGALFVGILSGAVLAITAMPPAITAAPVPTNGQASAAPSATTTASATGTPTGQPTASNPTPQPTSTPRILPTPTTPPIGATLNLSGTVVSVNVVNQTTGTFVLRYHSNGYTLFMTCQVSSSTTWTTTSGSIPDISTLQSDVAAGHNVHASVNGKYEGNSALTATSVDAYVVIDN